MKIVSFCATEKKGVTYRLQEAFLEEFRDSAEITEFYFPKDCPAFCRGCAICVRKDPNLCREAEYIQKIDKAMREADLLVFSSPAYVFHTTGAMKAFLDHFAYRWMPHRPAVEMFGKRAVIITQCLGGGGKSAAKDIKDSLSWWGVSDIRVRSFKLMSEIEWDRLPDKKRSEMTGSVKALARKLASVDYSKRAHANIVTKSKFYVVRMLQTALGKNHPEYIDFNYWKANGWIGKVRPWK